MSLTGIETIIIVLHVLAAISIVGLVLIQQGKGADAGASFGSGASATVFGSQGSATFLSKLTAILAAAFFATSLGLGYYAKQKVESVSQAGLPSAAAIEASQAPVDNDVPVVDQQNTDTASDVPAVE